MGINGYWRGDEPAGSLGSERGRQTGVVGGEDTGLFLDLSNEDLTTNGFIK